MIVSGLNIPAMHFVAAAVCCSIAKPNRVTTIMINYWTTDIFLLFLFK